MNFPRRAQAGFSLTEVMVSVIVICIGLLGIAKMQALSLSNSNTARLRSLAAIEAASLASIMHSNRNYWGGAAPPASITLNAGAVASSDPTLVANLGFSCFAAACTPVQLAGFDFNRWVQSLQGLLPNPQVTVACPAVANSPVACTILIRWTENAVAIGAQQVGQANQIQTPDYLLYVEP
jgi:type IV pilus assembly protein PilV